MKGIGSEFSERLVFILLVFYDTACAEEKDSSQHKNAGYHQEFISVQVEAKNTGMHFVQKEHTCSCLIIEQRD